MLGYFVLLYIYQKIFLPRNLRWSTLIVYLVELPPLIMTILMGTVLDSTHQALTFLLFICTLPVFILDKPWRVLSYSLFWTLLFLLLVFVFKDPKTWKVTVKTSQNLHKEKASNYRMLFSFNHFSTGHEAGTA